VSSQPSKLREIYEGYCPDSQRIPFEEATQQLNEAFIRVREKETFARYADWIHPSYRDLVIDELTADSDLRTQFLRRASLEGVKIAVSDTGGQEGQRRLPFMLSGESWRVLEDRCLSIISDGNQDSDMLEVLASAAAKSTSNDLAARWERLLTAVCNAVRGKWDATQRVINSREIGAFERARSSIKSLIQLPDLTHTWGRTEEEFRGSLDGDPELRDFDLSPLDDLTSLATVVEKLDPAFLMQRNFPLGLEDDMRFFLRVAEREICSDLDYDDPSRMRSHASDVSRFVDSIERFDFTASEVGDEAYEYTNKLRKRVEELERRASEMDPPEREFDREEYGRPHPNDAGFDVNALFEEL
jgi:hypothetical protein